MHCRCMQGEASATERAIRGDGSLRLLDRPATASRTTRDRSSKRKQSLVDEIGPMRPHPRLTVVALPPLASEHEIAGGGPVEAPRDSLHLLPAIDHQI